MVKQRENQQGKYEKTKNKKKQSNSDIIVSWILV